MNDIIFTQLRLSELETLIEKSLEKVIAKLNIKQPEPSLTQNDIIYIDEVCILTNLRKATIYTLVSKKAIPIIKPAGTKKLMFSRVGIIEWLQQGRPSIAELKADYYINHRR